MGLLAVNYAQISNFQRRLVAFHQETYSISTLAAVKCSSTASVSLIGTVPPDCVWRDAASIDFLRAARPKMRRKPANTLQRALTGRSKWSDCANNSTRTSIPGGCKKGLESVSDYIRCGYSSSSAVASSLRLGNYCWLCFGIWSWRCASHTLVPFQRKTINYFLCQLQCWWD